MNPKTVDEKTVRKSHRDLYAFLRAIADAGEDELAEVWNEHRKCLVLAREIVHSEITSGDPGVDDE